MPAGVADDLAGAAARAAGAANREETLLVEHFAAAVAGGAGAGAAARLGARRPGSGRRPPVRGTWMSAFKPNTRLLESDFQIVADVFAALRAAARRPPPAAERSPKPKKSPRMSLKSENGIRIEAAARRALQTGVPIAVVGRALLRVAQDAVRLGGLFELVLGARDRPGCGRDGI